MRMPVRRVHQDLGGKWDMAIELVMCGMNDGDIAKRVGVSRQTINTWRNHGQDFHALLAERRVIGEVRPEWHQGMRSPAVYPVGSQKTIMKISSLCFILIVTMINWHSFLFVSKNEY